VDRAALGDLDQRSFCPWSSGSFQDDLALDPVDPAFLRLAVGAVLSVDLLVTDGRDARCSGQPLALAYMRSVIEVHHRGPRRAARTASALIVPPAATGSSDQSWWRPIRMSCKRPDPLVTVTSIPLT